MSVKTVMKLEQFFELPDFDETTGETYELDHGELIVMPPSPAEHEFIKKRIAEILRDHLRTSRLGKVLVETGYTLEGESWRRPDVSLLTAERLAQVDRRKPLAGAPDLAVEVHSPSDSKRVLSRKVRHFLEAGTRVVWVVYPDTKEVNVIQNGGDEWLGVEDKISLSLLPGFEADVRRFFED